MIPEPELNKSTSTLGFNIQLILPKHTRPWNPTSKWATEIDRKRKTTEYPLFPELQLLPAYVPRPSLVFFYSFILEEA